MATVPNTNRHLWDALDEIYARQRDAAEDALNSIEALLANNSELSQDTLAHDAGRAAIERQKGMLRYAESQAALAETMRGYWADRVDAANSRLLAAYGETARRAIPTNSTPSPARAAASTNVAE